MKIIKIWKRTSSSSVATNSEYSSIRSQNFWLILTFSFIMSITRRQNAPQEREMFKIAWQLLSAGLFPPSIFVMQAGINNISAIVCGFLGFIISSATLSVHFLYLCEIRTVTVMNLFQRPTKIISCMNEGIFSWEMSLQFIGNRFSITEFFTTNDASDFDASGKKIKINIALLPKH